MNIRYFENDIDPVIVSRGSRYHADERVGPIEVEGTSYRAVVHGSIDYQVMVALDHEGDILEYACECPYDLGPICKHVVALLYAVRDFMEEEPTGPEHERTPRQVPPIKPDPDAELSVLQAKIDQLSKEKLASVLKSIVGISDPVGLLVNLFATTGQEKLDAAKKLIHMHVREARSNGFIERRLVLEAMQGYWIVLDEAMACDDPAAAIELCLFALDDLSRLEGFDDSDGYWMTTWTHGTDVMGDILEFHLETIPTDARVTLFKSMLKQIRKFAAFDIDMAGGGLVELLSMFSDETSCRRKYLDLLSDMYVASDADGYLRKALEQMIYHDLQKHGSAADADRYLRDHIDNPDFRDMIIETAIGDERYDEALACIDAGRLHDAKLAGLVKRWNQKELTLRLKIGDTAKASSLARELILDGDATYYDAFVNLFPEDDRDTHIDRLLDDLEQPRGRRDTYIKILIRAGRTERMMLLCEAHPEHIVDLHPRLVKTHRDRAMSCFVTFIAGEAKHASNRSNYRRIVRYVKLFRTAFGDAWIPLVDQLVKTFSTRPAMLDELKSLSHKTVA